MRMIPTTIASSALGSNNSSIIATALPYPSPSFSSTKFTAVILVASVTFASAIVSGVDPGCVVLPYLTTSFAAEARAAAAAAKTAFLHQSRTMRPIASKGTESCLISPLGTATSNVDGRSGRIRGWQRQRHCAMSLPQPQLQPHIVSRAASERDRDNVSSGRRIDVSRTKHNDGTYECDDRNDEYEYVGDDDDEDEDDDEEDDDNHDDNDLGPLLESIKARVSPNNARRIRPGINRDDEGENHVRDMSTVGDDNVDASRIFHGRGGLYPQSSLCRHLTLDHYPPVFVLTSHRHGRTLTDEELWRIRNALSESVVMRNGDGNRNGGRDDDGDDEESASEEASLVYQHRGSPSSASSSKMAAAAAATTTVIVSGSVPNPHVVTQANGTEQYYVKVDRDLNHGLFLDASVARSYVRRLCLDLASEMNKENDDGQWDSTTHDWPDADADADTAVLGNDTTSKTNVKIKGPRVLNLFSYTCSFSISALLGGASEVINVDMSRAALSVGKRNHALNGVGTSGESGGIIGKGKARFFHHNVFKSWSKIRKYGPYDIVVIDPPTYQSGSFVAARDYGKVIRRLPSLLRGGNDNDNDIAGGSKKGGRALLCLNAPELGTDFIHNAVRAETAGSGLRFVERLDDACGFDVKDRERGLKVLVYEMAAILE